MPKYLLAHDLGTSGNKASLYTTEGELVGSETYHYRLYVTNDNWAEEDPEDWWKAVYETTSRLIQKVDPRDIAAVSFSGLMMGCLCVDKQGKPLRNALIWADMRAVEQEQAVRDQIDELTYYRITGHRLSCAYGAFKLMWIRDHEPEVYAKTYKMLNAKDYILLKLTGNFLTEYTDAASTGILDLQELNWSERLLEITGLDRDKLPKLCQSTDIAGTVTEEASKLCGLPVGTPVVCGGGDGVCAAVGSGCVDDGIANNCIGTSSWISVTTRNPVLDPQMRTVTWPHIVPGFVMPAGTMQCGGGAWNWAVEQFCGKEALLAEQQGVNKYDLLEQQVAEIPAGSNGLMFLPHLIGERSPRWNTEAKGAFLGLKLEHTREHFLRAVMEGVALNLNVVLETFRENGCEIREMIALGGGVRSAVWRQIFADVYRTPLIRPNHLEHATSMGAAVTGGVGVGVFKDFQAVWKFLKQEETHTPIEENAAAYDRLKPLFDQSYEALEPLFHSFSALSAE